MEDKRYCRGAEVSVLARVEIVANGSKESLRGIGNSVISYTNFNRLIISTTIPARLNGVMK
jgi:hypothetical protein